VIDHHVVPSARDDGFWPIRSRTELRAIDFPFLPTATRPVSMSALSRQRRRSFGRDRRQTEGHRRNRRTRSWSVPRPPREAWVAVRSVSPMAIHRSAGRLLRRPRPPQRRRGHSCEMPSSTERWDRCRARWHSTVALETMVALETGNRALAQLVSLLDVGSSILTRPLHHTGPTTDPQPAVRCRTGASAGAGGHRDQQFSPLLRKRRRPALVEAENQ
jgi:hypothetical protein